MAKFSVEFLNAEHGDCTLVQWINPANFKQHTMLIDGGPPTTWRAALLPRLIDAADPIETIDVICVSHSDDDHVGGILELLQDNIDAEAANRPHRFTIGEVWFSFPLSASDQGNTRTGNSFEASVKQAMDMTARVVRLDLPTRGPDFVPGQTIDVHGLAVTVLAPPVSAVNKLAVKWEQRAHPANREGRPVSYPDRSATNSASIALYLKHGDATVLVSGDSLGRTILDGIDSTPHLRDEHPVHVDVLHVPHHGSAASTRQEFFNRVYANTYVVSSIGGNKHGHPHPEVLEWIVNSREPSADFCLAFTNAPSSDTLEVIRKLRFGRAFRLAVRNSTQRSIVALVSSD